MSSFAQDFLQMMNAYDVLRKQWINCYGSDSGFDGWFKSQMESAK